MKCIKTLVDEDFGLKSINFDNPRIRYGARGIIIGLDGKIAIFNKTKKGEYKLPGGGIDEGESPEAAFKREALEETGCEIEIIKLLGTIEEDKSLDNFKQISYAFAAKVVNDDYCLNLTQKEKDEGARLLWVKDSDALKLITNCYDKLKASEYENLYHSKFIVMRDKYIMEYYLNNKGEILK